MNCVNIDWLEVFCTDTTGLDAEYFKNFYHVEERQFGTPQYREMFTILSEDRQPQLEIRRNPYSVKENGGIFNRSDCHIRLSNRTCYCQDPIGFLRNFLLRFKYKYKTISRIDICRDFTEFNSQLPEEFLKKYMKGELVKIRQSRLASFGEELSVHGKDSFKQEKIWNSAKWGSPSSSVSTKLYNKSLEMKNKKRKYYIEEAWRQAGIDFENKDVWRIEFSLKSEIKGFVNIQDGELIPSTLSNYDAPDKLSRVWCQLATRFFDFRKFEDGKRKDRLKKVDLFNLTDYSNYKPCRLTMKQDFTRTEKLLINYLCELKDKMQLTKQQENSIYTTLSLVEKRRSNIIKELDNIFSLHSENE